jgi:hypothetical protein
MIEKHLYRERIEKRVEAVQLLDENFDDVLEWTEGEAGSNPLAHDGRVRWIWVRKTGQRADVGDWVLRDGFGRFSVVFAGKFEALWEEVR